MRKNLPRKEMNIETQKRRMMTKKSLTSPILTEMLQESQDQTKIVGEIHVIGHINQAERKMIERKEKQKVILRKKNVRKGLKKINLTTSQKQLATL